MVGSALIGSAFLMVSILGALDAVDVSIRNCAAAGDRYYA